MREIKFRGKRKDNGEWVYGYYVVYAYPTDELPRHIINHRIYVQLEDMDCSVFYEVIPETVDEFTGLKDKNGVEIYKGDKVRAKNSPMWEVRYQKNYCRYVLWWDDPEDGISYVLFSKDIALEVIGNIHEDEE